QRQIVFFQQEIHAGSGALDRSRHDVSRDAKTLGVSVIAHAVQFFDGDVVALAVLHPGVGKIAEGEQNQHGYRPKFQILADFTRHGTPHTWLTKLYALPSYGSRCGTDGSVRILFRADAVRPPQLLLIPLHLQCPSAVYTNSQ